MLKLHGVPRSNYTSLARACLIAKGVSFEDAKAAPSQDADFLSRSPMGRIPCLETEHGFISETLAIAEYLDAIEPSRPLLPRAPYARAKNLELIRHLELDVELVARRCLPAAFFGAPLSDETKESARRDLARGMQAVERLIVCDPFAAGTEFTLADLYAFYTFTLAGAIVQKIYGEDLLAGHPRIRDLIERLGSHDVIREVESAKQ